MPKTSWPFTLAVVSIIAAASARADYAPFQGYVEMPQVLAPMVMGNLATENLRLIHQRNAGAAREPGVSRSTLAPPQRGMNTAAVLAARYPQSQRARIEQVFGEVFRKYQQIEARLGLPPDDLASAVAAYVTGNYMALHDTDVPDEHFKATVTQMRSLLAQNTALGRASEAQRRASYEQMATVGTFMAATRLAMKQQPGNAHHAERFRRAARANLEQLLGSGVDRMRIGADGMKWQ